MVTNCEITDDIMITAHAQNIEIDWEGRRKMSFARTGASILSFTLSRRRSNLLDCQAKLCY